MVDQEATRLNPGDEWDRLIFSYLEGKESAEILSEIRELLPDTRFQKRLAIYAVDTAQLSEFIGRNEFAIKDSLCASANCAAELLVDSANSSPFTRESSSVGRFSRLSFLAAALAASVILVVGFSGYFKRDTAGLQAHEENPFLCTLDSSAGRVLIGEEAADGFKGLAAGQTIRTIGALSSVRLLFMDGTAIQLAGDSSLRMHETDGQKQIYLDYGHAAADVNPQSQGKPLMLYTSSAVLEVVGTEFTVSDQSESTELSVTEGIVLMKPRSGGKAIPVRSGEYSEVRLAKILPPLQLVAAPEIWHEDFDAGLPDMWGRGEWVEDLSRDSPGGAVAATCRQTDLDPGDYHSHYQVTSQDQWTSGLVRVLEDSELSYRIRMDEPMWYQVFICVRSEAVQDKSWSWNYEYQEATDTQWHRIEPGAWRELKVPLSHFKQIFDGPPRESYDPFELRDGKAPPIDGLVVWVMFTTQKDNRGMVIDDIMIGPPQN